MKINCHRAAGSRGQGTAGSAIDPRRAAGAPSRRGIALVITLIMLSVTLVMAIAFLALARRERNAVSTTTDTTNAKLAADSALATAQAQIMASILNTNSALTPSNTLYNFGLLVSTNFINNIGFNPAVNGSNPTNVNYNFTSDGSAYNVGDFIQNVANLQYLPRVPVFIQTNAAGSNDFRFYLDLNRNGQFDDTGNNVPFVENDGTTNGITSEVGDPQWIGVLARPDTTHSPDNQFLSRFAFIAVPIGNGLDINAIHNQSIQVPTTGDSATSTYLRNEGVGSWEINLAAFLADLNTNEWDVPGAGNDYNYDEPNTFNKGAAFQDALSILNYRYNYNYSSLYTLQGLFPNNTNYLVDQPIDLFPAGGLLTGTGIPFYPNSLTGLYWPGSVNTNHFYDLPSDIFDFNPGASSPNFTNRLASAGTNNSTYNRYTYYRLLAQMGTDSDPDDGKMNLNFSNAIVQYNGNGVVTNIAVIPGAETNLVPWRPLDFFTAAADRMLRLYSTNWFADSPSNFLATYYNLTLTNINFHYKSYYYYNAFGSNVAYDPSGFGLTNISTSKFLGWTNAVPALSITNLPVYVNGQFVYSPAVNRMLQMAANLYDATTTNFYPSVFRPLFKTDGLGNVFIVGYTNLYSNANGVNTVSGETDLQLNLPVDVTTISNANPNNIIFNAGSSVNVYGVPWIIGAKKNLPGFNQLTLLNSVQVNRLLQLGRAPQIDGGWGPVYTNHMYVMSISNAMSSSFWNSYSNNYPTNYSGPLNLSASVADTVEMVMTNSDHPGVPSILTFSTNFTFNPSVWPGSQWTAEDGGTPNVNSFLANNWTNTFISQEIYKTGVKAFALSTDPDPWESNNTSCDPLPQFGLITTNWLRAVILDNNEHVVDYVQLRGPSDGTNFSTAINDPNANGQIYLWATNAFGSGPTPSWGYVNQMKVSTGSASAPSSAVWNNPTLPSIPGMSSVAAAQAYLSSMLTPSSSFVFNGITYTNNEPIVQAGYTATRTAFAPYLYQVNDPLVHYLASDLNAGSGAVWAGGASVTNGIWAQNNGVIAFPIPVPPTGADIIKGRYQPWGKTAPTALQGNTYNFGNPYNLIYKDPLVWGADGWNFLTNIYPTVGWIGRVHRGTPWQTVYLKSTNVITPGNIYGTNTWAAWTGDGNLYDAANSAPVQDRLLFDLFTTRPNDNAVLGTLSVNQTNLAAWSAVFSGMVALTNVGNFPKFAVPPNPNLIASNSWVIIPPAGINGFNSALGNLVTNINNARAGTNVLLGFTNADGVVGSFEHVGDILSTPALTTRSPFLNISNVNQVNFGISDAAYEWLPQQMMGLVRESSDPRYVIYCYGQALRPAPNGLVTSASNFGLVTNYQVVAESVVRAVVSVHAQVNMSGFYPVTNYTTRVESYNVLPPE